jgi:mono/diheme cytochrome c family protein
MCKSSLVLLLAATTAAFAGVAQQSNTKLKEVPIKPTSPVSGQQMYTTYCASCHGADGKGNGPAAPALKIPATDLTTLSQKNGGKFPSAHVATVLRFGVENVAHGTAQMPVWGDLMQTLGPPSQAGSSVMHQRISNLTDYIKQMQK